MATINFSISEELKEEFQTTFEKENRSALIAQFMRKAIEERKQQARRSAVIASILDCAQDLDHEAVGRDLHVLEDDLRFRDAAEPHRRLALADHQTGDDHRVQRRAAQMQHNSRGEQRERDRRQADHRRAPIEREEEQHEAERELRELRRRRRTGPEAVQHLDQLRPVPPFVALHPPDRHRIGRGHALRMARISQGRGCFAGVGTTKSADEVTPGGRHHFLQ